jgi:hypothetical protein
MAHVTIPPPADNERTAAQEREPELLGPSDRGVEAEDSHGAAVRAQKPPVESIHGGCQEQRRYHPRKWAFAPEGWHPEQEEITEQTDRNDRRERKQSLQTGQLGCW